MSDINKTSFTQLLSEFYSCRSRLLDRPEDLRVAFDSLMKQASYSITDVRISLFGESSFCLSYVNPQFELSLRVFPRKDLVIADWFCFQGKVELSTMMKQMKQLFQAETYLCLEIKRGQNSLIQK